MSVQTLKSANTVRVDIGKAQHLAGARQNLGEPLLCPAGAHHLQNDVYMRPVSQNTLLLDDASCSNHTEFSAARRIQIENMERPYLPVCAAGLRGGDLMGKGRDLQPKNLYGEGSRGSFVRTYSTPTNHYNEVITSPPYYHQKQQPFTFSHDATKGYYYQG